ncbi:MAG: ABC transporter substrate-binding protein [Neomegalonema sp.]|nr:ABC transporter substrate-binding protein [Neomegalonema sp.]
MKYLGKMLAAAASAAVLVGGIATAEQEKKPLKIGIPVFLSGAAAGPFGLPERKAAELVIDALNAGKVPAPYTKIGVNGRKIAPTFVDEAADAPTEYRALVEREKVEVVVGYTSSGKCKAIAPLAEELKAFTVFIDCGTPQIFEEIVTKPKFLFRTGPTATPDNVGAARYLVDSGIDLSRVAGINQNYAWGQDSWRDFSTSLAALGVKSKIVDKQFPKIFAGEYGAEVSSLLTSTPTVVHTSFWGGDLEAFVLQSAPRGLFARTRVVMTTGEALFPRLAKDIPEGAIVGARGPFSIFAPDTELARWFAKAYEEKYGESPTYPAWKMAQALFGVKAAYEAAGVDATPEEAAAALVGLEFEAPAGIVKMAIGNGHQAIQSIAYGVYKLGADGKPTVEKVRTYKAECVNPPNGMTSAKWIAAGFPGAKCK